MEARVLECGEEVRRVNALDAKEAQGGSRGQRGSTFSGGRWEKTLRDWRGRGERYCPGDCSRMPSLDRGAGAGRVFSFGRPLPRESGSLTLRLEAGPPGELPGCPQG